MLNENYRKYVSFMLQTSGDKTKNVELSTYIDRTGVARVFRQDCWFTAAAPYAESDNSLSLIVGDGTTPAKDTDVQLENEIKGLTCVVATTSEVSTNVVKTVSITFKNNTADTKTINEVGLIIQTNGYTPMAALLGRVVLDTPVVMSPGDVYTFTYYIE